MNEFCKDEDGCTVTLAVKDWDNTVGLVSSQGPYKLFLSRTTNVWRISDLNADGTDNANSAQNILVFSSHCAFSDAENAQTGVDNAIGFSLYRASGSIPSKTCILDIED